MKIHTLFFFFSSLNIQLIHSTNVNCPNYQCGSNNVFFISYPFTLREHQHQPHVCSNYIDLTCTSNNDTVLNLPFSGDFYVSDIFYSTNKISLYDPQDCLPGQLMNLDLSSSPFVAIHLQNYTFYSCPVSEKLFSDGFSPIRCLSSYANATVASSHVPPGEMMKDYGCSAIVTVEIPVDGLDQFDGLGIFSNLMLKWMVVPGCSDCEESGDQEQDMSASHLSKYMGLLILLGVSCFGCFTTALVGRISSNRAAALASVEEVAMPPRPTTTTGGGAVTSPDEDYVKTMTISTLLEGDFGPLVAHDQGSSCPICLEEYSPRDKIRCLTVCHHYFHAKCIDQWFEKNSSCPVCRTSILDVNL